MSADTIKRLKRGFRRPSPFVKREETALCGGLNIITACAGGGKTAYLSQLAEEGECVCISLGNEDDSPEGIASLLREAVPAVSEGDTVVSSAERICAYLQESGARLLIDNADRITDPAASSILRLLAECSAEGGFVAVFAAREIPFFLLPLAMEGAAEVHRLNGFTRSEIKKLSVLCGRELSDTALSELYSFTGGWCIAVSQLIKCEDTDPCRAADSSLLAEYIGQNILSSLDSDLRDTLLRVSLIQGDEELYREGLGMTDISFLRARLINKGLVSCDDGYMSCPQVMARLLSQMIPRDERNGLITQAAEYHIKKKSLAEAVRLFEQSGNSRAAERILALYGERLLANCEFELIGYCGRITGAYEGIKEPEALGALAQYHYYCGEYDKMEQCFNLADSMFGKENLYSVTRRLYNGLLRFEKNPALYTGNVLSAVSWLRDNDKSLPFLYSRERDILDSLTAPAPEETRKAGIYRFGGLHLYAGKDHTEIQCRTRRSAELIAYMLLHKGGPVGRDELLSAFWHEDMPANAVAMLHNIIYHLRRELSAYGLENMISYKNRYYTLDTSLINEEDADILAVCKAAEAGDAESLARRPGLLKSYWGAYLGSADMPWANERREYYDRCFVTACTLLAGHEAAQGRPAEAEALLKNAYRLDPFSEQIVYELLGCYSALGKPDKARLCYEEYSARLDAEFGTRPSKWLRNRFFSVFSNT